MNSFESHQDTPQRKLEEIESVAEEITRLRINPIDFKDHPSFNEDEINDDLNHCREKELRIVEQKKEFTPEQLAETEHGLRAEYAFRHAIQDFGWLSNKVNMIVASQFDDYFRGIDSIAQIDIGPGNLENIGFALDFSTSLEDLGHKLAQTFDSIDNGYTPTVKYFDSEKTGKIKNFRVPRIVVGAGKDTFHRLSEYGKELSSNPLTMTESKKQEMINDSFKHILIGEIIAQLSIYCNRLKKVIAQAKVEWNNDVERRAVESLSIHEKALKNIQELALSNGSDMATIQKNIRFDSFATKMGTSLSALSLTPIIFKDRNKK